MQKILIDSDPLIALFDATDMYHEKNIETNAGCVLGGDRKKIFVELR